MDMKEYVGFDVSKSAKQSAEFALSPEYKKIMQKYLSDLSPQKRNQLIALLKNAMKSGETIKSLSKKINNIIDDPIRSEMIARTESVRLANEGKILMAEERGISKMEFISAPEDGRLCEECKKHDGKIYSLSQAKGMIPIHPHCRCTLNEVD